MRELRRRWPTSLAAKTACSSIPIIRYCLQRRQPGIGLMLDTFVDAGDRVVIFDPSFFIYRLTAQNRGAKLVPLATRLDDGRTVFVEKQLSKALRWRCGCCFLTRRRIRPAACSTPQRSRRSPGGARNATC